MRTKKEIDAALFSRVQNEMLRQADVMDLTGCGRVRANSIVEAAGVPLPLPDTGYLEVPVTVAPGNEVVVVTPSNDVARKTIKNGVYLRDHDLAQPLRRIATHYATDIEGEIRIWPIIGWAIVADGSVRPSFTAPEPDKVASDAWGVLERDLAYLWSRRSDVLILGEELPLDRPIPLGYAGKGGIPGVRHVRLADLISADQYKGVPSV